MLVPQAAKAPKACTNVRHCKLLSSQELTEARKEEK